MDPQETEPAGGGDTEQKKVASMRALVERRDPQAKEVDNAMLTRFLRARDLNIDKASDMFLKYLKWKREIVPNGFVSDAEVKNELAQKKMFMQGFDKKGRPIAVAFIAKYCYAKGEMDEFKRFVVYILDKLCASTSAAQEKFLIIADLEGWGYSNCDIRAYLVALETLQNYYPERLGKAFMIHVPRLFMKAWKVIYPFLDKNTKHKFVFLENKDLKANLLEEIDESQLPDIYGGKLPLVLIGPVGN
ncbi:phosphatidylinositol/phosphatidylcholine transfer protein SFH2-like [Iris pallida]|uniref:Phosphatidylinositol/phosphatidylcholine transfer protein SFH2-like n=1 Tax=Iris pallida TaxID=29817 RepID=A0AAX6GV11_IRIPA|nr:phosphatidylinositol/phosphatidylcholine transfer protein SFH2-like [Iris pallida]